MDVLLTERTEQGTKARNPIRVKVPNLFSYGESITRKICQCCVFSKQSLSLKDFVPIKCHT